METVKYREFCIKENGKEQFRFWQRGGGFDRNLWNAKAVHALIRYIEANPVRRGLVANTEDWKWSSAWGRKNKEDAIVVPDEFKIPVL